MHVHEHRRQLCTPLGQPQMPFAPFGEPLDHVAEGAANLPVTTPNVIYGGLSHSPCAEFCSDGPPGTRTPSSACKLASYPRGPNDAPFPYPRREQHDDW